MTRPLARHSALAVRKACRDAQRRARREAAEAALKEWQAQQDAGRFKRNATVFAVLLATVCACAAVMGLSSGNGWPVLFALAIPLFWVSWRRPLPSSAEYHGFPHALDDEGKHRCIHCGHKTVTWSSPDLTYATANCEHCKRPLYRGSATSGA